MNYRDIKTEEEDAWLEGILRKWHGWRWRVRNVLFPAIFTVPCRKWKQNKNKTQPKIPDNSDFRKIELSFLASQSTVVL